MIEAAIVGAGPYGLSIAAHFRRRGLPFRIFGPPMDSWLTHMPEGMMLKSDGFASNLSDPEGRMTLKEFCQERGIPYDDTALPVSLETFTRYGLAFKDRIVPELESKMVATVEHLGDSYELTLSDGEQVRARRVILAVGITHFAYVPDCIAHLPEEFVTHSFQHKRVGTRRGCHVVVIGGGASAIGLAGLMRTAGVDSHLLVRDSELKFHGAPSGKPRTLWQSIRHPKSGLGPGLRSRFCANSPEWFHLLPEKLRIEAVRRHLGPSGHWVSKDVVLGKVPLMLGCSPEGAAVRNGKVILHVRQTDGTLRDVITDHVVAGTGYRVQMERLRFLKPELIAKIKTAAGSPVLSSKFESSVPGLYFVGLAAANSFGPVMRFAYGAEFAARNLTRTITRAATLGRAVSPAGCSVQVEDQVEEMSR
jgi:Pyridine nucleotide-disulphide oxidoreductase